MGAFTPHSDWGKQQGNHGVCFLVWAIRCQISVFLSFFLFVGIHSYYWTKSSHLQFFISIRPWWFSFLLRFWKITVLCGYVESEDGTVVTVTSQKMVEVKNCTVGAQHAIFLFQENVATKDTPPPSSPRPPPRPTHPPKKDCCFFLLEILYINRTPTPTMPKSTEQVLRLEESTTETHHGIDASGDLEKLHQTSNQDHVSLHPRKLQHTPGTHPRQSPYPTMKGFPLQPVGKGLGVCSKGVLKQP